MLAASLLISACGNGGGSPVTSDMVGLERAFPGLSFNRPVDLVAPPGDNSRWFVVEKSGVVRMFSNNDAAVSSTLSLDLSGKVDPTGEGGLLGMAFSPSFAGSGDVFLYYTETGPDSSTPLVSNVSRFAVNAGGIIDSGSESLVLSVDQPATNHNGGDLAFGPDGYLYIALGDGGGTGDPFLNGQDTTTLLGSILRIDVDGPQPYAIPAGNVFASSSTDRREIFAWGLRNPWRFSFDRAAGGLWAGDVGQDNWEEVDLIVSGGNYGWNVEEGAHCFSPPTGCDDTGLIDPVVEYDHTQGQSITGGYVYRGSAIPQVQGFYLFADWVTGRLWGFDINRSPPEVILFEEAGFRIVSFAEDTDGELYVLDYFGGGVYRLVPGL